MVSILMKSGLVVHVIRLVLILGETQIVYYYKLGKIAFKALIEFLIKNGVHKGIFESFDALFYFFNFGIEIR
jgi:hypothetical protein